MENSDQHLKIATDIAYQDLDKVIKKMYYKTGDSPTIEEIITFAERHGQESVVKNIEKKLNLPEHANVKDDILHWRIVEVHNKNGKDDNGFYGTVIDTGEGLVVSFRGSEPMTNHQHAKQDWVDADMALVNSTSTAQQAEDEKFLNKIQNSDYIQKYDNITFTGHSLGGNLAFHATIMSANPEKFPDIYSRLQQGVNFDGPGFSNEYIEAHKEQIALVADKMDHYQWSVVGSILEPLPGVNYETLATKPSDGNVKDKFVHHIGGKHSTDGLQFAPDTGMASRNPEGKTNFDFTLGKFTEVIDRLPAPVGNLLVGVLGGVIVVATWDNSLFKQAAAAGSAAIIYAAGVAAIVSPAVVANVVLAVVVVGVALGAIVVLGAALEVIIETVTKIAQEVAELVGMALNFAQEKINELKDFIQTEIAKAQEWFKSTFNAGYKYANEHPIIKINTYKLRNYANRLESVNRRLGSLDRKMDALYTKVGLLDALSLIQADLMTGKNWKIKKNIAYLEETASDFERAERNIAQNV